MFIVVGWVDPKAGHRLPSTNLLPTFSLPHGKVHRRVDSQRQHKVLYSHLLGPKPQSRSRLRAWFHRAHRPVRVSATSESRATP